LERAILGAALLNGEVLPLIDRAVSISDFFVLAHRRIFGALQKLAAAGSPINLPSVCDALRNDQDVADAGGAGYISRLSDGIYGKAPVADWAQKVRESSVLRQLATEGELLMRSALAPGASVRELMASISSLSQTYGLYCASAKPLLSTISAQELLARDIKPRGMLLDPVVPEQGLVMLYAYRGIGKTFVALGMAAAVAAGGQFLRWNAGKPRRVLYIDGELPASTLKERVRLILAGMESPEPAPDALQFLTPDLQERAMPDLATAEGQRLLEPLVEQAELIVVDNLSALCRSGSENDGEDWAPVQEWNLSLRRRGKSVLQVHHAGKNKSQRGTSKREDLLDTVISLRHPSDYKPSQGLRCEVHFEKTRSMLSQAARPFEVTLETGEESRAILDLQRP